MACTHGTFAKLSNICQGRIILAEVGADKIHLLLLLSLHRSYAIDVSSTTRAAARPGNSLAALLRGSRLTRMHLDTTRWRGSWPVNLPA